MSNRLGRSKLLRASIASTCALVSIASIGATQQIMTSARADLPVRVVRQEAFLTRVGGVERSGSLEFEIDHRNGFLTAVGAPSGLTFVLEATRVIRFSGDGRPLGATGRQGAGPGEFRRLWRGCVIPGDTLVAMDNALARLTWIAPSGKLVRSLQSPSGGELLESGCLGDGSIILHVPVSGNAGTRSREQLLRLFPNGTVARLPVLFEAEDIFATIRAPVGISAVGKRIVVSDSRTNEISVYSERGTMLRRITSRDRQIPLSDADVRKNSSLDSRDGAAVPRSRPIGPYTAPAFSDAVLSSTGEILLRERSTGRKESDVWTLLDSLGTPRARIRLVLTGSPAFTRVLQLTAERMFIMWRDHDGAAHFAWIARPEAFTAN